MSTPTPNAVVGNPFSILSVDDDDDETVITSNRTAKTSSQNDDDATATTANTTDDELTDDESNGSDTPDASAQVTPILPCHITVPPGPRTEKVLVPQQQLHTSLEEGTTRTDPRHRCPVRYALFDSGATAHFLIEDAPVTNKKVAATPLTITLPDGSRVRSTHTCNLDIPWLPDSMTGAHIVPQLAHSSLISTKQFCDAGCKVTFDVDECRVYYKDELVLIGNRDPESRLWRLPINPRAKPANNPAIEPLDLHTRPNQPITHSAFNVYTIPYRQNQLKYMHQCFLSPPIGTMLHAIQNKQLEGIPFMKSKMVRRHLAKSPATAKGRMKRPRTGIRSTRHRKRGSSAAVVACPPPNHPTATNTTPETMPVIVPDETHEVSNVFCYAALADKQKGTFYTDATGALPTVSLDGNQYYFIAYDYDLNYIFATPIKDVKDAMLVTTCKDIFKILKDK